jgi:TPR repeat protein
MGVVLHRYEVAQSNAAMLLEQGVCGVLSPLQCERLALRYYKHASKQGNAEASLKVGDAYYYGKVSSCYNGQHPPAVA